METNLLDRMLNSYVAGQVPVTITLQNKVRVSGKIRAFDSYVIVMEGQKREILYRHAISSVTTAPQEEAKRQPSVVRPAAAKTPPARPHRQADHKARPAHRQTPPPAAETSINSSMKDGLLKWMQEQKAAK